MIIHLEIEADFISGKFASRSSVAEAIIAEIEGIEVEADEGTYEIASASEYTPPKPVRGHKTVTPPA